LRRPLNVGAAAEVAGLSLSRFSHLFSRTIGMPPQPWNELQRLNRARQLLELTNLSIKEIAVEVGFDDPF
jgi:AraC family transcriptional regulator, arabinose operon regulatory protein